MADCPKCGKGSDSLDLPKDLSKYVSGAKVKCRKCGEAFSMKMQGKSGPQVLEDIKKQILGPFK